jgi:hypothetical protein
MSVNKRGQRDGSGPYKESYQKRQGKKGKRQLAGEKCPKGAK